jgi:pyruvate kinase
MRRQRNAKIVATLGPASGDAATVAALFEAGADVFRFNFSHGTHEDHRARHRMVREIERQTGRPIAILADLQGPKLRVGGFGAGPVRLDEGALFMLDMVDLPGDASRVCLPHPELFGAVAAGHTLLIDDGKLRLHVEQVDAERIRTRVAASSRTARASMCRTSSCRSLR